MTRQIPMLFSPAMVEALLAGRKTETRRILKPQPYRIPERQGLAWLPGDFAWPTGTGSQIISNRPHPPQGYLDKYHSTPTAPGDLIWVKEAHYAFGWWETTDELTKKTQKPKRQFVRYPAKPVLFEAPADVMTSQPEQRSGWYKRSSLFLPKLESRLTLRVTGFNIEPLQNIDEEAAIGEGINAWGNGNGTFYGVAGADLPMGEFYRCPVHCYQDLWKRINGPNAWDANPWVDVTKFDVLHQNVQGVAA